MSDDCITIVYNLFTVNYNNARLKCSHKITLVPEYNKLVWD